MKKMIQNTNDVLSVKRAILRDYQAQLDKINVKKLTPELTEKVAFLKARIALWQDEVRRFSFLARQQKEVTIIR